MSSSTEKYTPFDFIKSASQTKVDLVSTSENPEDVEKQYNPFIINRGFSYFQDTILHANEMNQRHSLPKDAQYKYYMHSLRSRSRFSKWFKAEKSDTLDLIQKHYQCTRNIAIQYSKLLTPEMLKEISSKYDKGGI